MGKHDKLLFQILRGLSDANIGFDEMCSLLKHFEFEVRIRGSHHIFRKAGVAEKINLQKDGAKVKSYQVRQVRNVILKYGLAQEV